MRRIAEQLAEPDEMTFENSFGAPTSRYPWEGRSPPRRASRTHAAHHLSLAAHQLVSGKLCVPVVCPLLDAVTAQARASEAPVLRAPIEPLRPAAADAPPRARAPLRHRPGFPEMLPLRLALTCTDHAAALVAVVRVRSELMTALHRASIMPLDEGTREADPLPEISILGSPPSARDLLPTA